MLLIKKKEQVEECYMLQRLHTVNSGNTGNNEQQILITEY